MGVREAAGEVAVGRVQRDADRDRLAVPQLVVGEPLELVRRPVPEVQRPLRAELERVAAGGDVVQVQLGAAVHELRHRRQRALVEIGRVVLDPDLSRVGPDAAEISRRDFRGLVGKGRAPLKARLLNQTVIAGVGNLLADEALWRARLSPRREAGSLSDEELDRLSRDLRAATRRAVRRGGVHTGDLIPHRHRGGVCPRCGATLERATVGGRTTYWCPREQPA